MRHTRSEATFTQDVLPILQENCQECHRWSATRLEFERGLTQDEIDMIVRWAETGAKRGDPTDTPEPPADATEFARDIALTTTTNMPYNLN